MEQSAGSGAAVTAGVTTAVTAGGRSVFSTPPSSTAATPTTGSSSSGAPTAKPVRLLAIRNVYEPAAVQLFIIIIIIILFQMSSRYKMCLLANVIQYYAVLRLESDLFCWFRI